MRINLSVIRKFTEWLEIDCELSPYTVDTYTKVAKLKILNKSSKTVNSIKFFNKLKREMKKEGRFPAAIKMYVMALKKFLLFLFENYQIPIIEISHIKCKNPKQKPVEYLTLEEIDMIRQVKLLSWLEVRARTLFEFILSTGVRAVEATNIKLDEIDFHTKELMILGKGNKQRKVYIEGAEEWIKRYCNIRPNDSPSLFANQFGGQLSYKQLYKNLIWFGKKTDISKPLTSHLIRKTCITYLIWSGADPKVVQMMAGHDSIDTTFRYYVGVSEERMIAAHKMLIGITKEKNKICT